MNARELKLSPEALIAEQARQNAAKRAKKARVRARPGVREEAERVAAKKTGKRAADAKVYAEVRDRDHGMCTVTLPISLVGACDGRLTIDHQWGRGKAPTTVENCRMLCWAHHQRKTDSEPDRVTHLRDFLRHALTHGYLQEAAKADAMIALELAQHPEAQR